MRRKIYTMCTMEIHRKKRILSTLLLKSRLIYSHLKQNHSAFICFICLCSWLSLHLKRGFCRKNKLENHCFHNEVKQQQRFRTILGNLAHMHVLVFIMHHAVLGSILIYFSKLSTCHRFQSKYRFQQLSRCFFYLPLPQE